MKIEKRDNGQIKLCHCKLGDTVQLVDEHLRIKYGYYMVILDSAYRSDKEEDFSSLYDYKGTVKVVNIETGITEQPHLSSKVVKCKTCKMMM